MTFHADSLLRGLYISRQRRQASPITLKRLLYSSVETFAQLADWLEFYAKALELNVWTSSTVTHASQDEQMKWHVTVRRADGTERVLHVEHLILAPGWAGVPHTPDIPHQVSCAVRLSCRSSELIGVQEKYQGQVLHSASHRSARDHIGKKVVIIGSCNSGKSCPLLVFQAAVLLAVC